jgi:hypothetical protein
VPIPCVLFWGRYSLQPISAGLSTCPGFSATRVGCQFEFKELNGLALYLYVRLTRAGVKPL